MKRDSDMMDMMMSHAGGHNQLQRNIQPRQVRTTLTQIDTRCA